MRADRPSQLTRAQNAEILSYVLRFKEFPDEPKHPTGRELHEVRFEAARQMNQGARLVHRQTA